MQMDQEKSRMYRLFALYYYNTNTPVKAALQLGLPVLEKESLPENLFRRRYY